MSLNFADQKKRQKYLVALVVLIVVIGAILWFGYSGSSRIKNLFSSPDIPQEPVSNIVLTGMDFSIFENLLLKELQPFFQIPPYEGKVGRSNPFAEWQASGKPR